MNIHKTLAIVLAAFSAAPWTAAAETFKESFECTFEPGLVNRPTPQRLVFSVDEFGRSVRLHDVKIPKITTAAGVGRVSRDTPKVLLIAWVGSN